MLRIIDGFFAVYPDKHRFTFTDCVGAAETRAASQNAWPALSVVHCRLDAGATSALTLPSGTPGVPGLEEGATPEEIAACERSGEACDRSCAALQRTEPTTTAGIVAALWHATDHETVVDDAETFLHSLIGGLRKIETAA